LLFPVLVLLPYYCAKVYKQHRVASELIEAVAQSNSTTHKALELLQRGPVEPWNGMRFEEVGRLEPPDYRGFEFLSDSQIVDLRPWRLNDPRRAEENSWTYSVRTLMVRKKPQTTGDNLLRVQLRSGSPKVATRCQDHDLHPVLRLCRERAPGASTPIYVWELALDFSKVPVGEAVTVSIEQLCREGFQGRTDDESWVSLGLDEVTPWASMWVLMPEGKKYLDFKVSAFRSAKPGLVEPVDSGGRLRSRNAQILAFGLTAPKCGYTYECHWTYGDREAGAGSGDPAGTMDRNEEGVYMQWRTGRIVAAGAAPALVAVVIAGAVVVYLRARRPRRPPEATEASTQTIPGRAPEGPAGGGQDKPAVS
jgi:hypothetical protein